jgi:hypothetical protein
VAEIIKMNVFVSIKKLTTEAKMLCPSVWNKLTISVMYLLIAHFSRVIGIGKMSIIGLPREFKILFSYRPILN